MFMRMRNGRTVLTLSLTAGVAALVYAYGPLTAVDAAPHQDTSVDPAATPNDPDGSMARSLARMEGISLEEAKLRLKVMSEAPTLAAALAQKYPDQFVGIAAITEPSFHIMAYFAHVDLNKIDDDVRSLAGSAELRAALKLESTPHSKAEQSMRENDVLRIAQSIDPQASIARPIGAGSPKILVKRPEAFKARLRRSSQSVREALADIKIETVPVIKPVAAQ